MKNQFLIKQVCGLSIMLAGALLPLTSAQAADELSDRYQNGYLNDPYTNEVAPDTKSVMPRGAEGPMRSDDGMAQDRSMTRGQESGTEMSKPPLERSGGQETVWDKINNPLYP